MKNLINHLKDGAGWRYQATPREIATELEELVSLFPFLDFKKVEYTYDSGTIRREVGCGYFYRWTVNLQSLDKELVDRLYQYCYWTSRDISEVHPDYPEKRRWKTAQFYVSKDKKLLYIDCREG